MSIAFGYEDDPAAKSRICRAVLAGLRLWFGIPESNEECCAGVKDNTFVKILDGDTVAGQSVPVMIKEL